MSQNVQYVDQANGRSSVRVVPEGAPQSSWGSGIIVGPPDLSELGLPEEVTTRLHNELFNRSIIRSSDARPRRAEVHAALMAAFRVDSERIIQLYEEHGNA